MTWRNRLQARFPPSGSTASLHLKPRHGVHESEYSDSAPVKSIGICVGIKRLRMAPRRVPAERRSSTVNANSRFGAIAGGRHHRIRNLCRHARPLDAQRRISRRRDSRHRAAPALPGKRVQAIQKSCPRELVHAVEALGAGGYVLIGLGCLAAGGAFLQNVLPFGTKGSIFSGGTIALIDVSVGLEVSGESPCC